VYIECGVAAPGFGTGGEHRRGKNNNRYGVEHTKETKELISLRTKEMMSSDAVKAKLRKRRHGSTGHNFGIANGVNVYDRVLGTTQRISTEEYQKNKIRFVHVCSKEYKQLKLGNL
jgi:hypothetical protein